MAQLLGHLCGDARIGGEKKPGRRHLLTAHEGVKVLLSLGERIFLVPGVGDKIGPSRQHFPDGAHHRGDVLDAVHDLLFVVEEDDVAVLAHQLDDQRVATQVAHLIEVLDLKAQDALETGLRHGEDPPVLQVLSKEHAESGRLKRRLSGPGSEISQRERGVGRQIEPALAASALRGRFEREDQLIAVRLRYFVYAGARKSAGELPAETGGGDSVKGHETRLLSCKLNVPGSNHLIIAQHGTVVALWGL